MAERINLDDPNADLLGLNDEELSEEEFLEKQLYGKNPGRVAALGDLVYDLMAKEIDELDIPEDAKRKMIFSMTANSVLDLVFDASPADLGLEASFCFDMYIGASLTNKKFKVDLFKELEQALMGVKRDDFPDDETYELALEEFEEKWWEIPQPLLDKRTPTDSIIEMLSKYGLTE
ncbi:MAG: hypothetical protein LBG63_04440 [Candidatus Methanoplasma sp.]|jgi:hypothetical protein|nr:hypothetical protein [Candidatus Methanoplasma sp.]